MSSITLQDALPRRLAKTSSRHLAKTSSRPLLNVFKTPCKNVFKKSLRHLQDVFKAYHQVKLVLLTHLRHVFNTLVRSTTKTVIYRRICLRVRICLTLLRHLWSVYKICKSDTNVSSFSFSLLCTF